MSARLFAFRPVDGALRSDALGDGAFFAPRGTLLVSRRKKFHRGVDLLVTPGEHVRAPADGVVVRRGTVYVTGVSFGLVEVACGSVIHRVLYIDPTVAAGDTVRTGSTIGLAQDLRLRYGPRIKPHIHWETMLTGVLLDKGKKNHHKVWVNPLTLTHAVVPPLVSG
ncbi:MAG: M23 family metallopeptidase [Thermoanaerobaculales bacterium]|nr:M23 family metallopeptidase [Thermoanaerobaculales bacterium]